MAQKSAAIEDLLKSKISEATLNACVARMVQKPCPDTLQSKLNHVLVGLRSIGRPLHPKYAIQSITDSRVESSQYPYRLGTGSFRSRAQIHSTRGRFSLAF
jgi:hypothetical protein